MADTKAFYAKVFPGTRLSKLAVDDLVTTKGGYRLASSIGGGVTGRGGDFIIIDDPMRAGDSNSETVRPGLNAWFDETLHTRLNGQESSSMLVVMQRLHQDDLTGHLLETGDWEQFTLQAVAERDHLYDLGYGRKHLFRTGDLMHADRLSQQVLDRLKRSLGSRNYDAQFQQNPAPADGQIFKRAWLKHGPIVLLPGDRIVQSWDAASKGGNQNDYSVCITAVVRRSEILILDVYRARLEFPDLKKKAIELAQLHRPYKLLIEDAAAGIQLIQMLRAEQPRGIPLPTPVKAVINKIERAVIAAARIESGALILPTAAPWLDDFTNELMAFPSGKHDDQVDALSHLMANTQNEATRRAMPWFGDNADHAVRYC